MLNENIMWISNVQMEFTTQHIRTIAYATIEKLFQGCQIATYRLVVGSEDVNVHDMEFIRLILQDAEKTTGKGTFKSQAEAKRFVKEKSIDGNYVLFKLKNRNQTEKNYRRIELLRGSKVENLCFEYHQSIEKLNNLFNKFE